MNCAVFTVASTLVGSLSPPTEIRAGAAYTPELEMNSASAAIVVSGRSIVGLPATPLPLTTDILPDEPLMVLGTMLPADALQSKPVAVKPAIDVKSVSSGCTSVKPRST